MSNEDETTLNLKNLNNLIASLSNNNHYIKVGVLGNGKERNATIGACHEFGTSRIPQRSFLRMPLTLKLSQYLEKAGLMEKNILDKIKDDKNLIAWLKRVAVAAEKVVLDAFATGGFGKWKPWKNPKYENNTGMILVDSQQLRDSISSEVI